MLIRFTFDGVAGADEFFNPNAAKFCAKNLVKLLHSGSSHGKIMVLPLNTLELYSMYAFTSF